MNDENSLFEVESRGAEVAVLTLNRPHRRNALTIDLMKQLCATFEQLAGDGRHRVIVLRGAGPAFCAGLDLIEAREAEVAEESARWVARTLSAVADSPLVTIAAAHGAAMAGGAGLMAACDLVVAASDLQIGFPEVRRGLVPALVTTVLRRRLSPASLRELYLLAEPIDAARAREIGLVSRVVGEPSLLGEALQLADACRRGAPHAVRQTKMLLRDMQDFSDQELQQEALALHQAARSSAEAQEGLAAFREKREPRWP